MPHLARIRALTAVLLLAAPTSGQAPEALPPALNFGTLYQHNVVQASVHLDWPAAVSGDKLVEAPPFVRVHQTSPRLLTVTIKTGTLGPLLGNITVVRGNQRVTIPVQATVLPRIAGQTRVLVANGLWHAQATDDDKAFEAWRRIVAIGKLQAHYVVSPIHGRWLPVDLLRQVDVVLVCEACLLEMTNDDVIALQGFACGGGRVIVCASEFYDGTIAKANDVTEAFGLRMQRPARPQVRAFDTAGGDVTEHALTTNVTTIRIQRPVTTSLDDERCQPLVKLSDFSEDPVIALAATESGGELITIGVPLWWTWIALGQDNERLWRNLMTRKPR